MQYAKELKQRKYSKKQSPSLGALAAKSPIMTAKYRRGRPQNYPHSLLDYAELGMDVDGINQSSDGYILHLHGSSEICAGIRTLDVFTDHIRMSWNIFQFFIFRNRSLSENTGGPNVAGQTNSSPPSARHGRCHLQLDSHNLIRSHVRGCTNMMKMLMVHSP